MLEQKEQESSNLYHSLGPGVFVRVAIERKTDFGEDSVKEKQESCEIADEEKEAESLG
jgi:hypothetical protein